MKSNESRRWDKPMQIDVTDFKHFCTTLHINNFSLPVTDASSLMKLDRRYTVFLGGLPDTASIIPDSVASKAPYIGCMRDVLIVPALTDFNEVSYKAGVELGTCKSEMPKIDGKLDYPKVLLYT